MAEKISKGNVGGIPKEILEGISGRIPKEIAEGFFFQEISDEIAGKKFWRIFEINSLRNFPQQFPKEVPKKFLK